MHLNYSTVLMLNFLDFGELFCQHPFEVTSSKKKWK
jgi:hypothetical protein